MQPWDGSQAFWLGEVGMAEERLMQAMYQRISCARWRYAVVVRARDPRSWVFLPPNGGCIVTPCGREVAGTAQGIVAEAVLCSEDEDLGLEQGVGSVKCSSEAGSNDQLHPVAQTLAMPYLRNRRANRCTADLSAAAGEKSRARSGAVARGRS
jgi:hypothetical protein